MSFSASSKRWKLYGTNTELDSEVEQGIERREGKRYFVLKTTNSFHGFITGLSLITIIYLHNGWVFSIFFFFTVCFFFYYEIICWFKEKCVFISYFYEADAFFYILFQMGMKWCSKAILKNMGSCHKWLWWKSLPLIDKHILSMKNVVSHKTVYILYTYIL